MSDDANKIAVYRLKRADDTFAEAEILFKSNSLAGAVNRYYYAAFYAARALLALKGLDSSKHSGVISLFGQNFVKTGLIAPEIAKVLSESFEERIDADYEDFVVPEREQVEGIRAHVKDFIAACKKAAF